MVSTFTWRRNETFDTGRASSSESKSSCEERGDYRTFSVEIAASKMRPIGEKERMKPPEASARAELYFPSRDELALFQQAAALEGKPLSVWLREQAARRARAVLASKKHRCPACGEVPRGGPRAARKKAAA